jgi:hypothetical protein
MTTHRSSLVSMASSVAIAACLAGAAPLMAQSKYEYLFITGDSEDPHFNQPYIDVEEWRDEPAEVPNLLGLTTQRQGAPPIKARHLYVHGGFKGTDTKFTFYFPPKEQYEGRFYQATHQLMTNENSTPYNVAMTLAAGAYVVQTNMGGSEMARSAELNVAGGTDPSIGSYRANAAAAKYSRVVAQRVYERKHRPHGYLYGGSGGSYQVMDSAQNTSGVWDGFIPYVAGDPVANPSQFLVRAHALRVLKDKWPSIMDAVEPGGSGDPDAGLNAEEKVALDEATRYGFPPRAWFNYVPQGTGPLGFVAAFVPLLDSRYFDDFWTKPGYIAPTSSARAMRIQSPATVVRVIEAPRPAVFSQFMVGMQLELSNVPSGDLTSADLIGASGESKGKSAPLGTVNGNIISFRLGANPAVVSGFHVGDTVTVDNSNYLALQTYYRHSIPKRGSVFDYPPTYDSFRNADGSPKYVQREILVGLKQNVENLAATQGKFQGKMIVVQSLMDGDALPWMAAWYQTKVRDVLGASIDDNYRLWYTDHAQHVSPTTPLQMTHVISYQGILEQALRDLSAWVEKGVAPPASTNFTVKEGQVHVPPSAAARKGIQPVVDLKVNGGVRTEVAAGQPVTFTATIETPPGTGSVVAADWDLEGTGEYPTAERLSSHKSAKVTVTASHAYTRPGVYFAAIRATSQRQGDAETPYARVQNLGRVRVVVK